MGGRGSSVDLSLRACGAEVVASDSCKLGVEGRDEDLSEVQPQEPRRGVALRLRIRLSQRLGGGIVLGPAAEADA